MKPTATKLSCVLVLSLSTCHAAPLGVDCPDSIALVEKVTADYPSWEVTPDKGKVAYYLQAVRVYAGHPEGMDNLAPNKSTRLRASLVDT